MYRKEYVDLYGSKIDHKLLWVIKQLFTEVEVNIHHFYRH